MASCQLPELPVPLVGHTRKQPAFQALLLPSPSLELLFPESLVWAQEGHRYGFLETVN